MKAVQIVKDINSETDLSFFVGEELTGLLFGRHHLIFHFGDDVSIGIESEIEVRVGNAPGVRFLDLIDSSQHLVKLLALKIIYAKHEMPYTLALTFENSVTVRVFGDVYGYESYQINFGDNVIVV
ncbi:MAG: hypothetical protein AAGA57_09340 [Planctomycetota bacterium]